MHRLFWPALISFMAPAQSVDAAADLLRKAQSVAESTMSWRAEVVERSEITGSGINLKSEVRTRIAVEPPLKMRRQNSGDDQTVLVCDGTEFFYSGDGHSYYRGEAKVNPDCDFALSRFYKLEKNPITTTIAGRDHVRLADGDRQCVLVRAGWKHETVNSVRTLCIDPASMIILRDLAETEEEKTGIRMVNTTTFITYESNPRFQPDTFKFSIPAGAVQATPR
jgi:outer membrane lipoprotein-sorting protein